MKSVNLLMLAIASCVIRVVAQPIGQEKSKRAQVLEMLGQSYSQQECGYYKAPRSPKQKALLNSAKEAQQEGDQARAQQAELQWAALGD